MRSHTTHYGVCSFLWGAQPANWLLGLAFGVAIGVYSYLRKQRYPESGPDADETRFPR